MDFATIIGLIIAFGAITGSYVIDGGSLHSVFLLAPMTIVIGGTLGATTISTSIDTVKRVPVFLKLAFLRKTPKFVETIDFLIAMADKARRDGVLGLDVYTRTLKDQFFRKAIQLVVDGTEATKIRDMLETEIAYLEERHKVGITFFRKAGGFAPTMGILGTVLALVHTLGNTSNADKMATSIAAAFIATLWGVGLANLFLLPVADKLKLRHEEELSYYELIMEGVIAIQSGENPRNIKTKLSAFVPAQMREVEY